MALRVAGSQTTIGSLIVGGVANEVLFLDAAGKLAQSSDLVFNSITAIHTIGGTTPGAGLVVTGGTITADSQRISITETRNNAGVTFGGAIKVVITDTASAAGSLAMQILGGAAGTTNLFSVSKAGQVACVQCVPSSYMLVTGGAYADINGFEVRALGGFAFSSNTDPFGSTDSSFTRIAAGLVGLGTGAQGSSAGRLKLTSTITAAVAVGSLNASPTIGEVQTVNDALAVTAKGATVAAGGTAVCQVMWNGSNWVGT